MEELLHHFKKWEHNNVSYVYNIQNKENGFYFLNRYGRARKEYTIENSLSHTLSKRLAQDVLVIAEEDTSKYHVMIKNQGLFGGLTFYLSKRFIIRYHNVYFVNEAIPQSLQKARNEFPFPLLLSALKEELEQLPAYRLLAATGMLTYKSITI